jgi:hypothetical protein
MTGASIIIPVYNALEFARACIESVYEARTSVPFESSWWTTVHIHHFGRQSYRGTIGIKGMGGTREMRPKYYFRVSPASGDWPMEGQ